MKAHWIVYVSGYGTNEYTIYDAEAPNGAGWMGPSTSVLLVLI